MTDDGSRKRTTCPEIIERPCILPRGHIGPCDGRTTWVDTMPPYPWPLNSLAQQCHEENKHWWSDVVTGERLSRNKGELLMLMVSELSECMEGERKGLMDTHLPHRRMAEVELADVLIRLFDYAGAFGYDLDGAVADKRAYNKHRADHKAAARQAPGGKQ